MDMSGTEGDMGQEPSRGARERALGLIGRGAVA